MNGPVLEDQIAAAQAYEELHVPALFRRWTKRVLDLAKVAPGHRVLDVACGTGILAREAAARVGASGSAAAVDLAPGMVAFAKRVAPEIEWRQASAEALPYSDQTFDAVVSQFGLMFFSDRRRAIREMMRVLVPGGRLSVAVWDKLENSPAYEIEVNLLQTLAGQEAADAIRAPFVLGGDGILAMLFESAGVNSAVVTTQNGTARFPSIRAMVEADLKGWLPVVGVPLKEQQIHSILNAAEDALHQYITAEGVVEFDMPAQIVTATKP